MRILLTQKGRSPVSGPNTRARRKGSPKVPGIPSDREQGSSEETWGVGLKNIKKLFEECGQRLEHKREASKGLKYLQD